MKDAPTEIPKKARSLRNSVFAIACVLMAGCTVPTSEVSSVSFNGEEGKQFLAANVPVKVEITRITDVNNTAASYGNAPKKSIDGQCTIREERYSVTMAVPGTVNLPAYSNGAKPLDVACTYAGGEIRQRIEPINLSRKARQNSNVGLALLCPICGLGSAVAGSAQGPNRGGDIFGFDAIELEL
ncbi:MAG: hypothetical protein AAFZ99_04105 [Pseudomonadota bacterium]